MVFNLTTVPIRIIGLAAKNDLAVLKISQQDRRVRGDIIPIHRQISSTDVPTFACRKADAICSFVYFLRYTALLLSISQRAQKVAFGSDQDTGSRPSRLLRLRLSFLLVRFTRSWLATSAKELAR